jgi:hypothetical protein
VRCARIDAHDMWCLSASELVETLARLRVPQLHVSIVTRGDKLRTIWREVDVVYRLGVARKRPQ